jgi:hypothetical protein
VLPWWQCHEAAAISFHAEFKSSKTLLIVNLPGVEHLLRKTLIMQMSQSEA